MGKWIPIEKRLPKEGECVLCTYADGRVDIEFQRWKKTGIARRVGNVYFEVIAWMPLPKPYEPRQFREKVREHIMSRFVKVE